MHVYLLTFTSNGPTYPHVDIFRLESSQPFPPETNSLQVHQDSTGHLKSRYHLRKIQKQEILGRKLRTSSHSLVWFINTRDIHKINRRSEAPSSLDKKPANVWLFSSKGKDTIGIVSQVK